MWKIVHLHGLLHFMGENDLLECFTEVYISEYLQAVKMTAIFS